ncbi:Sulfate transporter 91 [Hibiscus syriacus]|uniref:Sulfate transporter 91 n=1 Tax=Hibiscus syriacus TaxID=106335 RepID=A0A6A3AQE1_HIBSY|nr:Sulfate transporter 91 [Hibiscus syriacus]
MATNWPLNINGYPLHRRRLGQTRVWTDRLEMVKARARVGNYEPWSARAWCLVGRGECCRAYCSILMLHVGADGNGEPNCSARAWYWHGHDMGECWGAEPWHELVLLHMGCSKWQLLNRHDIDTWFHFAISKRVQKLEFDFEEVAEETWPPVLRSFSLTKRCFDYIRAPPGLSCIGALNSLCLRFVKVSGEVLEHFLTHCPQLEKLVVEWSKSLVSLKVATSSPLRLQYLEIRSCLTLQNLEISAPNLRTFRYYGQKMTLNIQDAPVLADVLIGGNLDDEPAFAFCPLSSYLHQLESLTLEMSAYNMMFPKFPELQKLRHLVISAKAGIDCDMFFIGVVLISVYGGYDDDLLVLTSLIDASPSLSKLSLEVEIVRFRGFKIDVEFVTYLLEHGEMLEKITINCCHPSWIGQIWEWQSIKERRQGSMLYNSNQYHLAPQLCAQGKFLPQVPLLCAQGAYRVYKWVYGSGEPTHSGDRMGIAAYCRLADLA